MNSLDPGFKLILLLWEATVIIKIHPLHENEGNICQGLKNTIYTHFAFFWNGKFNFATSVAQKRKKNEYACT